MTTVSTIELGGLVHHRAPLDSRDLVLVARRDGDGQLAVALVDVLAAMRVDASAEVLVATDPVGASLAIPLRDVLAISDCRIVLDDATIRIVVPGWTDDHPAFVVTSLAALTFGAFLGGAPHGGPGR